MKKFFKKVGEKIKKALVKLDLLKVAGKEKLASVSGAFGEQGTWAVIVVVIAGILLTLIVLLTKDKIFPSIEDKLDDFFQTT